VQATRKQRAHTTFERRVSEMSYYYQRDMDTDDVDEDYDDDMVVYIDNAYGSQQEHINAQYHDDVSPLVQPTSWFRSELDGEPQMYLFGSGFNSKQLEAWKECVQSLNRLEERMKNRETTVPPRPTTPPPSTPSVPVKKLFQDVKEKCRSRIQSHTLIQVQRSISVSEEQIKPKKELDKIDSLSNKVKELAAKVDNLITTFAPATIQPEVIQPVLPALSTIEASLPLVQAKSTSVVTEHSTPVIMLKPLIPVLKPSITALDPSPCNSMPSTSTNLSKFWCPHKSVSRRHINAMKLLPPLHPRSFFRPAPFIRPPPAPGEYVEWIFGSFF
jgi:hypothetical protein